MFNETIILLQNLTTVSAGSVFSFTNKTPGPGYYRQDNSTRTASYDFTNFVGTVKIQASLDLTPGDNDWFDVTGTTFVAGSSVNTTESYSFNGNFIWIRVAYNLQSGKINRVSVSGITVTASSQSISNVAFADITNKPTTVAGYGITDAVSASDLGAFEFTGSTITTTDSSTVTIDQATTITSDLTVSGDIVPQTANGGDLGSIARPWKSLYVSNNTVFLGGVPLSLEPGTNELRVNNIPVSQSITYTDIPNAPTDVSDLTDTDGLLGGGGAVDLSDYQSGNDDIRLNSNATIAILSDGITGIDANGTILKLYANNKYIEWNSDDLKLPANTDIVRDDGTGNFVSVLGGGTGPVQPYLELTNSPFIIQPVVLGSPVSVSTAGDGSGAEVEVVIGAGPVITSVTVTSPGTDYIVGQRYRVQYWEIGGNNDDSHIEFEVATVSSGGLLTVTDVAFTGEAAANNPGTYSNLGIQLRASPGDSIGPGLTLVRSYHRALFNIEAEAQYNNNTNTSPLGTEWNSEGWGNLTGFNTRTYTTFYEALNRAVGENIIGAELVMHDTINDQYYKFSFSNWGDNNGGSYAYTRTLIERDPNYFKKENYATANNVDVIEDDSTLQIGITRDNNGGIYNPFTEEEWDEDVSPDGTEWNIDGWDDLTNVETRTYTNFYDVYDQNIGNNILGSKAVMYVPSIDKYYAIQWLSWTQGQNYGGPGGGGFSYLRYEIDLDKLDEGVRFADGTRQKTAYIPTNVKLTAPGDRRIEEVAGYKEVSVTERLLRNITTTASRNSDQFARIWIDRTTTTIDEILNDYEAAGIIDNSTIQFSLDNTTWYRWGFGTSSDGDDRGYAIVTPNNIPLTYSEGDAVYFRYVGGGAAVIWWDKDELPGGGSDFRGAVIDYHAYIPSEGTIIGTIHIVSDSGDENITHTEVSSGTNDLEYVDLWFVTDEGEIKFRRTNDESSTLQIQWTAKVFYGSESYDD